MPSPGDTFTTHPVIPITSGTLPHQWELSVGFVAVADSTATHGWVISFTPPINLSMVVTIQVPLTATLATYALTVYDAVNHVWASTPNFTISASSSSGIPSSSSFGSPGSSSALGPPAATAGKLSHIRDYDGRRILTLVQGTSLSAFVYSLDDVLVSSSSSLSSFLVDPGSSTSSGSSGSSLSSGSCDNPRIHLNGDCLEVVYLRSGAPKLKRSRTHGRTWTVQDLPGTYTSITSVIHNNRLVLLGYRAVPASSSSSLSSSSGSPGGSAQGWYCRVGKLGTDGLYTMSSEVAIPMTTTANGIGELRNDRSDGVLDFTYTDNANAPHLLRGRKIALDGTGDWR